MRGNYDTELELLRSPRFLVIGGGAPGANQLGAIESGPHNRIHVWVGGTHSIVPGQIGGNMGQAFSPRDAVFLLHHGNIDRLWTVWTNLATGGAHKNPSDSIWLSQQFPMAHPSGIGTEVYKVGDLLNTSDWGYTYDVETVTLAAAASTGSSSGGPIASFVMNSAPLDLSKGIATTDKRRRAGPEAAAASNADRSATLVLADVKISYGTHTLAVYVRAPRFSDDTEANLVGIATILDPTGTKSGELRSLTISIPVPDRIRVLLNELDDYYFSIVAAAPAPEGPSPAAVQSLAGASVGEVRLEYE